MQLNINKKLISTLIAGGIVLNASMLDTKAPTTEDTIATIVADNLNEMYKKNIVKDTDVDVYYNREANYAVYNYTTFEPLTVENLKMAGEKIYEDISQFIGAPDFDKLTLINEKTVYDIKTVPTYSDIEIDGETKKVMTGTKEEKFVSGYEQYYIDPACEEYFEEKYGYSKVKQR